MICSYAGDQLEYVSNHSLVHLKKVIGKFERIKRHRE